MDRPMPSGWKPGDPPYQKRNARYPDFNKTDCKNFASQALHSAGLKFVGSGGCKHESTLSEWYATASRGYLCYGDQSTYAWTTTWVRVSAFWEYHTSTAKN